MTMTDSLHHQHDSEDDGFESFTLTDDGTFPNNAGLKVILYRDAIPLDSEDAAETVENVFLEHGWEGVWRNGIFGYHHFHATAHEVLGIASGEITLQLGGEEGPLIDMAPGDVVLLPAGVAHKNVDSSDDLVVVGAYPPGQIWDINTGGKAERPRVDDSIAAVPLPTTDPVYGPGGPLVTLWVP